MNSYMHKWLCERRPGILFLGGSRRRAKLGLKIGGHVLVTCPPIFNLRAECQRACAAGAHEPRPQKIIFPAVVHARCSGAVLVIVLWVLAVLTAIALGLSYRTGLEARRVGAISGNVQALTLCQAAIRRTMFELQKDEQGYDALKDLWSNNKQLFDSYRLQSGTYTVSYKRQDPMDSSKHQTFFGAMDEESLINVNTASKETWERLLRNEELSPDLYEPIMDWVDADSNARMHGAEASDYASLERPYAPRNGKIRMMDELLLIKGITSDVFDKLSPFLTVYGDGKININTASAKVFEAIGFSPELVDKILRFRKGLDDVEGTDDDGVFRDMPHIIDSLDKFESLSNADRFMLNNAMGLLTVSSRFFRIHVQGESTGGIMSRATVVVERFPNSQGIPPRIVSWKEN